MAVICELPEWPHNRNASAVVLARVKLLLYYMRHPVDLKQCSVSAFPRISISRCGNV